MGLYVKQKDNRSELQQRLDAELRAKALERSKGDGKTVDGVEDSAYIEGTKRTTSLAFAWLFIFFLALVALGVFIYRSTQGQ